MEGAPKTDSSQKSARRVGYAKDNAKRPAADLHAAVFSRDQGWSIPVPANESVGLELATKVWRRLMTLESIPFYCTLRAGRNSGPSWASSGYPAMRCYTVVQANQYEIFSIAPNYDAGTTRYAGGPSQIASDGNIVNDLCWPCAKSQRNADNREQGWTPQSSFEQRRVRTVNVRLSGQFLLRQPCCLRTSRMQDLSKCRRHRFPSQRRHLRPPARFP